MIGNQVHYLSSQISNNQLPIPHRRNLKFSTTNMWSARNSLLDPLVQSFRARTVPQVNKQHLRQRKMTVRTPNLQIEKYSLIEKSQLSLTFYRVYKASRVFPNSTGQAPRAITISWSSNSQVEILPTTSRISKNSHSKPSS